MSVLNQNIEDASNHSLGVPYLVQLICLKTYKLHTLINRYGF